MAELASWCVYLIVLGAAYVSAMMMALFLAYMGESGGAAVFFVFAIATGWLSHFVYQAKPRQSQS